MVFPTLSFRDLFLIRLHSYDLPQEAYTSCVYPRQSANGSTVIVYGHERGLRIIWYAGKTFKSAKKNNPATNTNGTAKSDPMVIDLDDDDDQEQPAAGDASVVPAEFEDEEEEVDPAKPYRGILRQIDIPLGSSALRIATPHISKDLAQAPPDSWPPIYHDRILVTVACADSSLRVLIAPLVPPSPELHDISKLDIQTLKILGPNSHQEFITDIAITHTIRAEGEEVEAETQAQMRLQTRSQPAPISTDADSQRWALLIASLSCTESGLLLVHQIPLQGNGTLSTKPEHLLPIRRQFLRSSALGARIAFNPSCYPADRHSSLLLTLPAASTVKLYKVFVNYPRERRGSTATSDSASTRASLRTSGSDKGRILLTFLPPFVHDPTAILPRRKKCLDAQWVASGRAVVSLLEDGEWGIWDLEAVGPNSSGIGSNLVRGQSNISGIQGGSITRFAIRSNIFASEMKKETSSSTQVRAATTSLAPMTPSTRKVRSEGLFQGTSKQDVRSASARNVRGYISVEEHPPHNGRPLDESVIISYGGENVYISSLSAFWRAEIKPARLPIIRLGGQELRGIATLPQATDDMPTTSIARFGLASSSLPDFVVQTPHRLILSVHALSVSADQPWRSLTGTEAISGAHTHPTFDQVLLNSGDLDVDGMDRILSNMGTVGRGSKPLDLSGNKMTFNYGNQDGGEDEEDVDMMVTSPTPSKYSARGLPAARIQRGEKRRGSYEHARLPATSLQREEEHRGSYGRAQPSTQRRIFS
ncbi:uncharacterized protein A1O9_00946 [Exophiala aquamarina CBS 119918]|uniref:Nucleoporin NUP37 n=1 Tax=Exophiala aquamarina CBS 119918 TaxID=1182545 RepID=A0A072PSW5_9EURO|nr:uncharacterized protein A1O9_00946 [Exophiala aquamarina CBS 119918]KEF62971.1 hypothetical protein A1O9_00946 [Exophiala aquamarina CBS 119918]